jgi:hypothetical protein
MKVLEAGGETLCYPGFGKLNQTCIPVLSLTGEVECHTHFIVPEGVSLFLHAKPLKE